MKIDIDFGECVQSYAEEKSLGYSTDDLLEPMKVLLDAAKNYDDATNIALDLLETIPESYRVVFMEQRGYIKQE